MMIPEVDNDKERGPVSVLAFAPKFVFGIFVSFCLFSLHNWSLYWSYFYSAIDAEVCMGEEGCVFLVHSS